MLDGKTPTVFIAVKVDVKGSINHPHNKVWVSLLIIQLKTRLTSQLSGALETQ